MLPLWIIDLTTDSSRRARLTELLEKTKFVYIKPDGIESPEDAEPINLDEKFEQDIIDEDYRWLYTHYEPATANSESAEDAIKILMQDLSEKNDEEMELFSESIYSLQNQLVRDGQKYVKMIRHSALKAYTTLNICVLGNAQEAFTQLLFPSVALLLQKEKGRMLANHVHQGMSIFGALFVPSDINSNEVQNREEVLRTLQEIEVQRLSSSVSGYDHVLLYQDVQNRIDKYYPLLNKEQQVDYVYQCLIHMFYVCNSQHPLISGVANADGFYLSLGVASVRFDDMIQMSLSSSEVANGLLDAFYAMPENDEREDEKQRRENSIFVSDEVLNSVKILKNFAPPHISLDVEPQPPYPDPINNFHHKHLKSDYFNEYLKDYIPEYRRRMNDEIESVTRPTLEVIHNAFNRSINDIQLQVIPTAVKRFIERCNPNDGGLHALESHLKNLKESLGKHKKRINDYAEDVIWNNVDTTIEKKYADFFSDYHNAYRSDLNNTKKKTSLCDSMKKDAIDDLANHMKQESPLLSRFVRAFMFGVICVLAILPILSLLSPNFINLGNINKYAGVWGFILFLIPVLWELYSAIRYLVLKERKLRKLKSYFIHDAYARIASRIRSESLNFYDKCNELADLYLKRCEKIRLEINKIKGTEEIVDRLPNTYFNRPLIGKSFMDKEILSPSDLEERQIFISHRKKVISSLTANDYFTLVHLLKANFNSLFEGVRIPEEHPYIIDENDGHVILKTPEDVIKEEEEKWNEIKENFKEDIAKEIEQELVPLQYPSACDIIERHYDKIGSNAFLKPFINFAATNGEFTTSADIQHTDIKTEKDKILRVVNNILPDAVCQPELGGDDFESQEAFDLYSKYVFLTRWCTFDSISLNRILPLEDFDLEEKKKQTNEAEIDGKKKKAKGKPEAEKVVENSEIAEYPISPSSTVLWALCYEDNSILWFKLFHSGILNMARDKKEIIYNKLRTRD